jgi:hypothetical protein
MSSSLNWNNPFHFNSFIGKFDKSEEFFGLEEKNQNMSMLLNNNIFNFSGEIQEMQLPTNIKEKEINMNEEINLNLFSKKDNGFDKSIYSIEQNFNETSHMILEEEFEKENKDKIGKDTGIEPIIESGEDGQNDSFFHENNYFIHYHDSSISLGVNNTNNTNNIINNNNNTNNNINNNNNIMSMSVINDTKLEFFDENEFLKIKKNLINLKLSKSSNSISYTNSLTKETTFNNYNNKSVINDNKKLFNVTKQGDDFLSSNMKLNMSSCLLSCKPKRGRKKLLLNGIKTEVIDKTFLREFKKYLKTKQKDYARIMEEDSIFWKEFLASSSTPFSFTSGGTKLEFKSYNKNFLKFIFSKSSASKLYTLFLKEKKDIVYHHQILPKRKVKKLDHQTLAFYMFYRNNLHKFYSPEYSANDINLDELDINNISADVINNNTSFQ